MLRPTTAGLAARTGRLLLLPALTALALACDHAPSPHEPPAPEDRPAPETDIPTRPDAGAANLPANFWSDGWLEADEENATAPYAPSSYAAMNRNGGQVIVTKVAGTTGRYMVRFPTLSAVLGSRSTVHVTSKYSSETSCKPAAPYLVSDTIEVRCFKLGTGAPENSMFSLLVTRNYDDRAFAYAHRPTATNYSPASRGSWNPAGGQKVVKTGVGKYRVTFNNLLAKLPPNVLGHVQVNAVGTDNAYCNAHNWGGRLDRRTCSSTCGAMGGPPAPRWTDGSPYSSPCPPPTSRMPGRTSRPSPCTTHTLTTARIRRSMASRSSAKPWAPTGSSGRVQRVISTATAIRR